MAVKVRTGAHAHDTYKTGGAIALQEGHLFVREWRDAAWETIAIYPPSRWLDAVVED